MNYLKLFRFPQLLLITLLLVCCKTNTKSSDDNVSDQPQRQEQGQQQGPSVENLLEEMDTDNDEKLAKSEVQGPLLDDFAKIDTNKDGFLTKEELENAPRPERRGPRENNNESEDNVQRDFAVTVNVDPTLFIKESLLSEITQEEHTLSNGTKALCYVITTASQP